MKKLVAIVLTFLLIITGCSTIKVTKVKDDIKTDNLKFRSEYTKMQDDNLYEYTTYDNVIDLISSGNGIVYFGYPDCTLCKDIVPILNEVAKEKEIPTIMYYNFKDIKDNNTSEYQKLVKLLDEHTDDELTEVVAPTIIFVTEGVIKDIYVGEDNEELSDEDKENIKIEFISLIDRMYETNDTESTETE